MTGKILIVDALATNRIILKVKLSTAFSTVFQASSGEIALGMAAQNAPDLVIVSGDLPNISTPALLRSLHEQSDRPSPVVVLLHDDSTEKRLEALRAGAADALGKTYPETVLLARLRSILRQHYADGDLQMHTETAHALGFAEEKVNFLGPEHIAILAENKLRAVALCNRLAPDCLHDLTTLSYNRPQSMRNLTPRPDVIAVQIGPDSPDAGMSAMAELQASPQTRHTRIVAVLDPGAAHLAAPLLDMGASDVMCGGADDRELLMRLSIQMAQKKRSDSMRSQLANGLKAALTDPLTGLYNRRYALNFLRQMLAGANRDGRTCAIMVADLDHFKSVNDTYGHSAGDRVLSRVAEEMRERLPEGAMIARVGGEEFLIAVPETSPTQTRALADQLRRVVRDTPVPLPDGSGPVRVTVSIGATLVTPNSDTLGANVEQLIDQADHALYDSKSGGRDTVTVSLRPAA